MADSKQAESEYRTAATVACVCVCVCVCVAYAGILVPHPGCARSRKKSSAARPGPRSSPPALVAPALVAPALSWLVAQLAAFRGR